jgi:hypothetical protein
MNLKVGDDSSDRLTVAVQVAGEPRRVQAGGQLVQGNMGGSASSTGTAA